MPFLTSLLSLSCTVERLAKEIRNLQRPEIAELFEEFSGEQVGSSTMPHKRNPHKSERICGLVRVIRGLFSAQIENIAVEHERDLTNSAPERIIFSDLIVLVDFILLEMKNILSRLMIDKESIQKNMKLSGGRNMSEAIMMKLSPIIGRQKAHELLNKISNESDFVTAVKENPIIKKYLSAREIDSLLKPENYLGLTKEKIDTVLESSRF
jgi:adenylosuccinate lyase